MLRVARVTKVHPEAHSVDLLYLDDMTREPLVQTLGDVFGDSGRIDLHEPTPLKSAADLEPSKKTDIYAVVGRIGTRSVVLGFLPPQVSQVLFKDRPNFRVDRHPSDVYTTLDDKGNLTVAWPNGSYMKVGDDPALEDLAGKDFDGKWALKRNKTAAVHVQLVLNGSDGAQKAALHIDPTGNATAELAGNLTQMVHGNLTQTVDGTASIAITGAATSSANSWTHTGPFDLHGTLHVTDEVTADKSVTATVDVVGGGKHLKTHTHSGVTAGAGTSGPPT